MAPTKNNVTAIVHIVDHRTIKSRYYCHVNGIALNLKQISKISV